MRVSKRKGFTLVELLIVIVVIGILAAGMMLASGSATESAKASRIISELRSAKAAATLWFADNAGAPNAEIEAMWAAEAVTHGEDVAPALITKAIRSYMDNNAKATVSNTRGVLGIGRYPAAGHIESYWVFINPNGVATDGQLFDIARKVGSMSPGMVAFGGPSERFPKLRADGVTPMTIDEYIAAFSLNASLVNFYMRVR